MKRTGWVALAASLLVAVGIVPSILGLAGPVATLVPGLIATSGLAAIALWLATLFPRSVKLRTQAFLLALGIASYAVGDLLWDYYVVRFGDGPFPGIPDIFYFGAMYLCLGSAGWFALFAYRRIDHRPGPLLAGLGVSVAALAAMWFGAVGRIVADQGEPTGELLMSVAYLLGDVFSLILPGAVIVAMLITMGSARFALPWWYITAGFFAIAIADAAYLLSEWTGLYRSGELLDAGWWIAFALITYGIAVLVDVHVPSRRS